MDLLLRNNGGRDRGPKYTIFVVWKAPNADGREVMSLGRESCLRPVEISCVCFVWLKYRVCVLYVVLAASRSARGDPTSFQGQLPYPTALGVRYGLYMV